MKTRAKLYRFRDDEWRERGLGSARLIRDNDYKQIAFQMKHEKTMIAIANFRLAE